MSYTESRSMIEIYYSTWNMSDIDIVRYQIRSVRSGSHIIIPINQ